MCCGLALCLIPALISLSLTGSGPALAPTSGAPDSLAEYVAVLFGVEHTGAGFVQALCVTTAGAVVMHAARHGRALASWALMLLAMTACLATCLCATHAVANSGLADAWAPILVACLVLLAMLSAPLWAPKVAGLEPTTIAWFERIESLAIAASLPLAAHLAGVFVLIRGLDNARATCRFSSCIRCRTDCCSYAAAREPDRECAAAHSSPLSPQPSEEQLDYRARLHSFATGEGVKVAVIDTGVARHDQLRHLSSGADLVAPESPEPHRDCDLHGTVVAGVIAGHDIGIAREQKSTLCARPARTIARKRKTVPPDRWTPWPAPLMTPPLPVPASSTSPLSPVSRQMWPRRSIPLAWIVLWRMRKTRGRGDRSIRQCVLWQL